MTGSARTYPRTAEMILPDPDVARMSLQTAGPDTPRAGRTSLELWELRGWDEV